MAGVLECCGVWGRWFGHHFVAYEIERETIPPGGGEYTYKGPRLPTIIKLLTKEKRSSVVMCRRCGVYPREVRQNAC